jgi:hypothetical protein
MKSIRIIILLMVSVFTVSVVAAEKTTENKTESVVASAFNKLGHKVKHHLDIQREPHLVLTSNVEGIKQMAVFFDDCDYKNICEDVTFYSNLDKVEVSDRRLNAWNHINAKKRSKAFRSSDGSIGLSMTVSFFDHSDTAGIEMLTGLFILESELLALTSHY